MLGVEVRGRREEGSLELQSDEEGSLDLWSIEL